MLLVKYPLKCSNLFSLLFPKNLNTLECENHRTSDGIRPVRKSLLLEFLQSREPVVGLGQEFSIFPHEHLSLVTYFGKLLIDLLLRLKFGKITKINNFLC